jgi:hypothetical protein
MKLPWLPHFTLQLFSGPHEAFMATSFSLSGCFRASCSFHGYLILALQLFSGPHEASMATSFSLSGCFRASCSFHGYLILALQLFSGPHEASMVTSFRSPAVFMIQLYSVLLLASYFVNKTIIKKTDGAGTPSVTYN